MTINLIWMILAFLIPSAIIGLTKYSIRRYLKEKRGPISKYESDKIDEETERFRKEKNDNLLRHNLIIIFSLLMWLIYLSMFVGALSVGGFTFNSINHFSCYILGILSLVSFIIVLLINYHLERKSFEIWSSEVGKEFQQNHPHLLLMNRKQFHYMRIARLIAIVLSVFNLFYFIFNV